VTAQREWVTFADPTDDMRRWQVDVTFLTSHWTCVFGCGCQGVLTEPTPEMEQGCCSYGAHFSDKRDRKRVEKFAEKLTDDDWQFAAAGRARGIATNKGHGRTRLVDDACIFLNRPDFPGGSGCALHRYALRTGQRPMDLKPEVCWQLPLRRVDDENDDGSITTRLTEFGREGWGDGGAEFAWWCTDAPEAFTAADPVYKTLSAELIGIMGATLYEQVAAYLDARCASSAPPIRHPAEVPVQLVTKKAKRVR
jgi:hypothetical protein